MSAGTEGSIYICQFSAGTLTRDRILGYLVISSSFKVRDVICMPPKSLRKTKGTWQFFSLARANRICIHSQITSKETFGRNRNKKRVKRNLKDPLDSLQIQEIGFLIF